MPPAYRDGRHHGKRRRRASATRPLSAGDEETHSACSLVAAPVKCRSNHRSHPCSRPRLPALAIAWDGVAPLFACSPGPGSSRSASIPGRAMSAPGCACRHHVTNVACTPEGKAVCSSDPRRCWGGVNDAGARENNPVVVTHDGQFDHVGTIGLRESQTKAPALSRHGVLSHKMPARHTNQPQERPLPTEGSDNSSDAIDTHVPIRVRPRRVTHHQLQRVAAVGERQRSVVCPQHIATAGSQVLCSSVNVHAHHPSLRELLGDTETRAAARRGDNSGSPACR